MTMLLTYDRVIKSIFMFLLLASLTACWGGNSNSGSSSSGDGYPVTTFAGKAGASGSADGIGDTARFANPHGITSDGTNLFIADSDTIRKIVIATGEVSTFAGTARTPGSRDGTRTLATFFGASGVTIVGTDLYVTETINNTIRKIDMVSGEVTTFAGTANTEGSSNGRGATARFSVPLGMASDGTHLFVADSGNHIIRKIIIATGMVTTMAGVAGDAQSRDGAGTAARFISRMTSSE